VDEGSMAKENIRKRDISQKKTKKRKGGNTHDAEKKRIEEKSEGEGRSDLEGKASAIGRQSPLGRRGTQQKERGVTRRNWEVRWGAHRWGGKRASAEPSILRRKF